MTTRKITFKRDIEPCPNCDNRREFTATSEQVAEDGCEVYLVCKCGTRPPSNFNYESVMGGVDDDNALNAMECWNDWIEAKRKEPNAH